ncbi:hypothetical protein LDENG_00233850 [Lucifuga dentata]|nr:hypothetical protein LDENG_00233850 [Lucifuga dentata]
MPPLHCCIFCSSMLRALRLTPDFNSQISPLYSTLFSQRNSQRLAEKLLYILNLIST